MVWFDERSAIRMVWAIVDGKHHVGDGGQNRAGEGPCGNGLAPLLFGGLAIEFGQDILLELRPWSQSGQRFIRFTQRR